MTCQDVIEFLMDYLAGTVPLNEKAVFESHLAICPGCVAFLQNYRQVLALTKDAVPKPSDAELVAQMPEQLVQAILAARGQGE